MIAEDIADLIEGERPNYGTELQWIFDVTVQQVPVGITNMGSMAMGTVVLVTFLAASPLMGNRWMMHCVQIPDVGAALNPEVIRAAIQDGVQNLRNIKAQVLAPTNGHQL